MRHHSPVGVRVVVSDLVVSLSAGVFIDLGWHFLSGQAGRIQSVSQSPMCRSKADRASYAQMKPLIHTVDVRPTHEKNSDNVTQWASVHNHDRHAGTLEPVGLIGRWRLLTSQLLSFPVFRCLVGVGDVRWWGCQRRQRSPRHKLNSPSPWQRREDRRQASHSRKVHVQLPVCTFAIKRLTRTVLRLGSSKNYNIIIFFHQFFLNW